MLALRTAQKKADGRERRVTQRKPSISPPANSQLVVRMTFEGADPQAEVVGLDKLPGIVNYFIGDDPSKWRTNIPTYQKVAYKNVYDGIDLVYYGNQGQLEYDLIVAPGADPSQIKLALDGAEQIAVDEQGDLVLSLPQSINEILQMESRRPSVCTSPSSIRWGLTATNISLPARMYSWPLRPHLLVLRPLALHASERPQVTFQVAAYDASQPLIIDPVLSWATYLGGSTHEFGIGIAVDPAGKAYVTGVAPTPGSGFPGTAGSLIQSTNGWRLGRLRHEAQRRRHGPRLFDLPGRQWR